MSTDNDPSAPATSRFGRQYVGDARAFSFAHQIRTVLHHQPTSVIEVGVGTGVVAAVLQQLNIQVTTLDIEPSLKPDLVGSVTQIPAADREFDVSLCCQVLEHLPFDQFASALRELRRVTCRGLVLSLPDRTWCLAVRVQLPLLGRRELVGSLPRWLTRDAHVIQPRHHWEIGYPGYPLRRIRAALVDAGWTLQRTWRVPEMTWHRFFDLRPTTP